MQNTQEKADLQKMKVEPQKYERLMWTKINFVLGKNEGYRPSSLCSRPIVAVSE